MKKIEVSIIGTVGLPAQYGGFETLVENLVKYHSTFKLPSSLTVYCSSKYFPDRRRVFLDARLKYVPLNANGVQSIFYDFISLMSACLNRSNVILLLGISGAIALPVVRIFSSMKIVTNIDGIEWRREKWGYLAKRFLKFSERVAVLWSHEIIADNQGIADYVYAHYGVRCHVIPYGGDHVLEAKDIKSSGFPLPEKYAFCLCRIEPENNVHMILKAFSRLKAHNLVVVGNWNNSEYGRELRKEYGGLDNIFMLDPIYELEDLKFLRSRSSLFIHGHSAGGTNPSLVEAMHFGKSVIAYDCLYNRYTTEDKAVYFKTSEDLIFEVETLDSNAELRIGNDMLEISRRRYMWSEIGNKYFSLLGE